MENDRPPVIGVVGRESAKVRLDVVEHSDQIRWIHLLSR